MSQRKPVVAPPILPTGAPRMEPRSAAEPTGPAGLATFAEEPATSIPGQADPPLGAHGGVAHPSNAVGALWALGAVGLFALIYASGKLSGTSANALQIMWLRYVGGLLTMLAVVILSGAYRKLSTRQPVLHACRAGAGGFGGVAAVYAATNMPIASATAIGLLDGLLTVVLGVLILRERVGGRQWLATVVCLAGACVVVASQGAFSWSLWNPALSWPALVALAGAMLVATESVLLKTLVRSEAAITVLFYVNLFGVLLLAGPALAQGGLPDHWGMAGFLLLGPIAIVAQYCNIQAFRATTASVVGALRYTWIVFGVCLGALFFDEPLTLAVLGGVGLVLCGGTWLAMLRNRG